MKMTKKEAFELARKLRSEGRTVKILRHTGIYTQPGRGVVGYDYYTVANR